jgi:hypothetical protein
MTLPSFKAAQNVPDATPLESVTTFDDNLPHSAKPAASTPARVMSILTFSIGFLSVSVAETLKAAQLLVPASDV